MSKTVRSTSDTSSGTSEEPEPPMGEPLWVFVFFPLLLALFYSVRFHLVSLMGAHILL